MAVHGHKLVIVESPAKAQTIAGYLGRGYVVESSIGHIRDLPQSAADIPAKIKGEPWAPARRRRRQRLRARTTWCPRDKKSHITKLKGLLKDADELYLATDEDREGEAIAWHLLDELKPKVPGPPDGLPRDHPAGDPAPRSRTRATSTWTSSRPRRPAASSTASTATRSRPVLWKKVMSGLSAGRVQSVATRLVVDRERERMAFRAASYWDLEGTFDAGAEARPADVPRQAALGRRRPGRPRLATSTSHGRAQGRARRRPPRPRPAPRRWPPALRDTTFDGPLGRGQALPPLALRAVPHHDAAAGGLAASSATAPRATM